MNLRSDREQVRGTNRSSGFILSFSLSLSLSLSLPLPLSLSLSRPLTVWGKPHKARHDDSDRYMSALPVPRLNHIYGVIIPPAMRSRTNEQTHRDTYRELTLNVEKSTQRVPPGEWKKRNPLVPFSSPLPDRFFCLGRAGTSRMKIKMPPR